MQALIDGDIVAYRCAASCEKIPTLVELAAMGKSIDDRESLIEYEPVEVAYLRIDALMQDICDTTGSDSYQVFITGNNNFRYEVNPEYKANRKDMRRPRYLQQCNEYLVLVWKAKVCDGYEADDAMGIAQTLAREAETDSTIICSIDKDLLMIVGHHYNFVKKELSHVTLLDGRRHFWKQMLIGDSVDNIIGIKGIGAAKAAKLIDHLEDEDDMYQVVYDLYNDDDRFKMNYHCLKILTKEPNEENYSDIIAVD